MTRADPQWLPALRLLFALEAAGMALILPRIPDLRDALGLSPSELGLALTGIPAGALLGFLVAPCLVRVCGSHTISWASVAFLAIAFVAVASARSLETFAIAWGLVGIGITHTEIALNAQASQYERDTGHPAMSSSHGYWSLGSIAGVLVGGLAAEIGILVAVQAALAALIFIPVSWRLGTRLRPVSSRAIRRRGLVLPRKDLLPLCLVPVGVLAIESAFMEWSAVFLVDALAAEPLVAALGFLCFSIATAISRLTGDTVAARIGDLRHAVISTVAAATGTAVFALAPSLSVALAGAFIAGYGAAPIYPLALSKAGHKDGRAEDNIAAISFAILVLLLGFPAAFGALVDAAGPRLAHLGLAVLAIPTAFLVLRLESGDPDRRNATR